MGKSKNLKIVGVRSSSASTSLHGTVVKVLKQSGKPLNVREITDRVLKIKKILSKTPLNSVAHTLYTSKHAERVSFGMYRYKP